MDYQIRIPAICEDLVPLVAVAEALAMSRATAGGTEFYKEAYDGTYKNSIQRLVGEVQAGRLPVYTRKNVMASANEVIEDAKQNGTYIVAVGDDALTMLLTSSPP